MRLRIAQIRLVPRKGDMAGNFARLRAALDGVRKHRPDVVVTPECFLDGYVSTETAVTRRTIRQYAIDPATSPYVREIAEWSARYRTWFIFGCTRNTPQGARNSALIFNRKGTLAGIYDKVHCQLHDQKYMPGNVLPVFNSDFGKFGVMICADRRWPETSRTLSLKGARVIFNPTYGMSCDLNLAMMRTRAYENEIFIAFTHPRQSLITGPGGEVIVNDRRRDPPFTVTAVNLAAVDQVHGGRHSHLKDRRVDTYWDGRARKAHDFRQRRK